MVASATAPGLGVAANALLFPGVARRDFVGLSGTRVETLVCAPTLPLAVAQWRGSGRTPQRLTLELPFSDAASGPRTIHHDGSTVVVGAGDALVAVGLVPPPASLEVVESAERGVRLEVETAPADLVSLLVAAGTPPALRASFAAARHLAVHAARAAAGPEGGLLLQSGVVELDDAVRWLRVRLRGRLRHAPLGAAARDRRGGDPDEAGWRSSALALGLAGAASGDGRGVERLLARLGDGPERAIIAARLASTLGVTAPARAVAEAWLSALAAGNESPYSAGPVAPLAAALLADALDRSVHADTVARLRRLSTQRPADGPAPTPSGIARADESTGRGSTTRERALPMANGGTVGSDDAGGGGGEGEGSAADGHERGQSRSGRAGDGRARARDERAGEEVTGPAPGAADLAWLKRLLDGDPAPAAPESRSPSVARARAATARFPSDPDGAWAEWRRLLSGPASANGPAILWDPPEAGADGESLSAELLLGLAHGLLGLSFDAPVGRIRIAPRIPAHVTALTVTGISVGDGSMALRYRGTDGVLRFELRPERGAVPPVVILEPLVPGRPKAVRVDGADADLELRAEGGRTQVPVQLALDAVRSLEIETG